MTNDDAAPRVGTPWHLWVVGGLMTLWASFGVFDFVATLVRFEPYLAMVPQELLDYVYGSPVWMFVFWGTANVGGFAGSILLLLRNRLAVPMLAISLAAVLAASVAGLFRPAPEGFENPWLTFVVILIVAALVAYAVWMRRRRVLR